MAPERYLAERYLDKESLLTYLRREREEFWHCQNFEVVPHPVVPVVQVKTSTRGFEIAAVEQKPNGELRNVDYCPTHYLPGRFEDDQLFEAHWRPMLAAREAAVKAAFRWAMCIGELSGWGELDTEEGIDRAAKIVQDRFASALQEMKSRARKIAEGRLCPLCDRDIHDADGCRHCKGKD